VKRAIALVIAVFGVSNLPIAHAEQTERSAVIDRTMVCTTGFAGGVPDRIRVFSISVGERHGTEPAEFDPSVGLNTGAGSGGSALIFVYTQDAPRVTPYVLIHGRRCTRMKGRLAVVAEERSATPVDFSEGCRVLDAPKRIVVRLRAVLERPTMLSMYRRDYFRASAKALEAFIAVRTYPGRQPIAFASFARDGSARFFAVPRCTE
jgi:hypothetical protein